MQIDEQVRRNLREVLSAVLDQEQDNFEEVIAEQGEDSEAARNHLFTLAISVYVDFGFDDDDDARRTI